MTVEDNFTQAFLANPRDNSLRLVYADWLEEQGDPVSLAKAEFLRLTEQLATASGSKGERRARRKRLQQLAAGLETDWLAIVSRLAVENCEGKRAKAESQRTYALRFDYLCDRRWDEMRPTENQEQRFCEGCQKNVHYCGTIMEARTHALQGNCIAVDLGIIRRNDDLAPERMWAGRPSPETVRQEKERVKPDPVSAERELRKKSAGKSPAGNSEENT